MSIDSPITAVEGIGPATAERLGAIGVERVADLFFVSDAQVHRACADLASYEEAASWRAMAAQMEVDGVDGQRAEALVLGGIETVEELAGKALSELLVLFDAAVADGSLPAMPQPDEIADMRVSAARIEMGGVTMGTLLDAEGGPVAGASVSCGVRSSTSDARGRFRIAGIHPATGSGLRVEADGQSPQWVEATVVHDPRMIGGPVVRLPAETPPVLDEFEGDALPDFEGRAVRTVRFEDNAPRDGELLIVQGSYATSDDVRTVSIFRALDAGEIIVRRARLAASVFEDGGPVQGELYVYSEGRLRRAAGGAGGVELYRAERRAVKALRDAGTELSEGDPAASISVFGEALRQQFLIHGADATSGS